MAELARKLPQAGLDHLDEALDQFLVHGQTTTNIVQSTLMPPQSLPPLEVARIGKVCRP